MDLEKAYDNADRAAIWQVLRMYKVSGILLKVVMRSYEHSFTCLRFHEKLSTCIWWTQMSSKFLSYSLLAWHLDGSLGHEEGLNQDTPPLQDSGYEISLIIQTQIPMP